MASFRGESEDDGKPLSRRLFDDSGSSEIEGLPTETPPVHSVTNVRFAQLPFFLRNYRIRHIIFRLQFVLAGCPVERDKLGVR